MSKVKIKNVSKDKSPFYCGLANNSSLALQFGQTKTVEENLLTDYIKRRAKLGFLLLTQVKVEEPTEVQSKVEDKVTSGKKKTTNKNKEV